MPLRVIEVVLPASEARDLAAVAGLTPQAGPWSTALEGGLVSTRFVLESDGEGDLVDDIQSRFGSVAGFHLLVLPATAALPRPAEPEEKARTYGSRGGGLTREELSHDARTMARPGRDYFATVVLSTIVVAIGLLRDSPAVIIGGMVIAPLLGPNVALSLATTLGDVPLMRKSLLTNAMGLVVALLITIGLGLIYMPAAPRAEISARTAVEYSDLLLALAAGGAGALALTTGVASALVGVMVAVALLPPTAVLGLMIGAGRWESAGGALLLLFVNVICVNLAATATFLVQGIRPRSWWEADQARRSTRLSLAIGALLILVLLGLIFATRGCPGPG